MTDNINKLQIINELSIDDTSNNHRYIFSVNELTNDRNIILPTLSSDSIFVFDSNSQTLTNKTLDSTTNTITADKLHSATTSITINTATAPTNGQVLTATSSTTANWQTPDYSHNTSYIYVYSNSNSTFTDTYIDINLDVERHKDSDFSHSANSAEITINTTDMYELSWTVTVTNNDTVEHGISECHLMLDTGSGYNEVVDSISYGYHNKNAGYNSHGRAIILSLSSGDKVKLQIRRGTGTESPILINNGCSIIIRKLTI
jgi:hypothetical protein